MRDTPLGSHLLKKDEKILNKKLIIHVLFWCTPKPLDTLNYESQGEKLRKDKELSTLLGSQHFEGRKMCWSSEMGTRMNDKRVNYSHKPTHTKHQVG